MPAPSTTDTAEVAAFAAALDDFMHAARRARGRLASEADLSLSQYHLLEPLLAVEGPAPHSDDAAPLAEDPGPATGRTPGESATEPGLGVGALACAAGVSPPTATRMLAGLERDGLVARRACPHDRRVVRVALTAAGAERMAAKRERIGARREELFQSLEPAERVHAARLLARLAAAIEDLR